MRNSSAKLKSVAYCIKLRMFELRMMSWHWMKMNILVVSLIVWTMGIRQQHESQLRLEKMCQKRQKHLMKSLKCDPRRQQCEPHGLDEHRDPEINHYTCSTIDSQISTLILMTLMSLWLINTKDKLLFDTSCTICATGLHRISFFFY